MKTLRGAFATHNLHREPGMMISLVFVGKLLFRKPVFAIEHLYASFCFQTINFIDALWPCNLKFPYFWR